MSISTATGFLRRFNGPGRRKILSQLPAVTRTLVKMSMRYPEGLVGAVMNPDVLTMPDDVQVGIVVEHARNNQNRLSSAVYIVDDSQRLLGYVDIRDLLVADDTIRIKDLAKGVEHQLSARSSLTSIRDHPGWNVLDTMPVVDHNGVFHGILERSQMENTISGGQFNRTGNEKITDTLISLVEVFWNICTDLLIKEPEMTVSKRSENDKSEK